MTTAAICAPREVSWSPSFDSGEQYDADLGLYYLRHRYYNPATGRFLSRDSKDGKSVDPQSLHKYLYAGGDPVNRIDPRGLEDEVEYSLAQDIGKIVATKVFAQLYCRAVVAVFTAIIVKLLWALNSTYSTYAAIGAGGAAGGACGYIP